MHINSHRKMADGVDIDLYADDLDQGFPSKDDFNDDVDLYDDVIAAPSSEPHDRGADNATPASQIDRTEQQHDTNNGFSHGSSGNGPPAHMGRRHQLYVGNLTWWTTDQDINDACHEIGVNDFQDVKFFENRTNGQSKGFCLISLASESSMRLCMDRLPKRDLHGQSPVVTLPTKQALNQFESQQKTRPVPPTTNNGPGPRVPGPGLLPGGPPQSQSGGLGGGGGGGGIGRDGGGGGGGYQSNHQSSRMMNPNGPPQYRPHGGGMQSQSMQGGGGPPRMQQPLMQHNPMGPQSQGGGPPRYQSQNQWNGPPRPNGPPRTGIPNGPQGPPQHRPMTLLPHPSTHHQQPPQQQQQQQYQGGGPQGPGGGMPPRGPRPDWNRPPMHVGGGGGGGYQQGGPPGGGHPQGPPHMQGPPRGAPPPPQMGGPHGPPQGPAPHVNPAFFNQGGGPPQHQGGPPLGGGGGPPHGGPHNMSGHGGGPPAHYQQQGGGPPRGPWPGPPIKQGGGGVFGDPMPQLNEVEFEEIMARNRTVSSSAIARAVSDAAAGEYSSAIETLVTAISLIKQSKVAHDERCKILISSLQDTLHGIETKSYSRRDRSRSRDRSHRRPRRERSSSRSYRERSRERDRDRERERDGRHYSESYRERDGRGDRSRSRGAERGSERSVAVASERGVERSDRGADRSGAVAEHYREESHQIDVANVRTNSQPLTSSSQNGGHLARSRTTAAATSSGGPSHTNISTSSRSARPRKSPEAVGGVEAAVDTSKRNYYDERYRSSDRERDRERDRDREHRSRH